MDDQEQQVETTETTTTQQPTSETPEQLKARLAEAEKRIKELNHESAERRTKLAAFEAAEQKRKEAEMTEAQKAAEQAQKALERAQKAEQDRDAAIARANETILKARVLLAAQTFNNPEDAWTFIDRAALKLNEDGTVEGIDKAIKAVTDARPYLLKAQTDPTKPRGTPQGGAKPTGNKPTGQPSKVKVTL